VWHAHKLDTRQVALVESWLGAPVLIEDLSWGLVDTAVLHLRAARADYIVKAAGAANHHIGRETTAHESYTAPLVERGAAARLAWASRDANVLVTEYLPGTLVEGSASEYASSTYVQAGRLLRAFQEGASRVEDDFERSATAKALSWLDAPHRIEEVAAAHAKRILASHRPQPVTVVPTHGDWQPRNWLEHEGRISVIDFGRFAFRPAATDLCRLAFQQWRDDPTLESAFLEGYGSDPRDDHTWPIMLLREAIGTAVWAFQVGDEPFEAQGHRMIADVLERFADPISDLTRRGDHVDDHGP
jgi:thiamine kinase-like enzyme